MAAAVMIIHVDERSAVPLFEQVRRQFVRLIASGQLAAGDQLPPIRQLANDLDIARGTIAKVYDALVRDGYVATNGRHGTIVLDTPSGTMTSADLDAAADALAVVVTQLDLDAKQAHLALDAALDRLRPGPNH